MVACTGFTLRQNRTRLSQRTKSGPGQGPISSQRTPWSGSGWIKKRAKVWNDVEICQKSCTIRHTNIKVLGTGQPLWPEKQFWENFRDSKLLKLNVSLVWNSFGTKMAHFWSSKQQTLLYRDGLNVSKRSKTESLVHWKIQLRQILFLCCLRCGPNGSAEVGAHQCDQMFSMKKVAQFGPKLALNWAQSKKGFTQRNSFSSEYWD
jgi:hypothetical protein